VPDVKVLTRSGNYLLKIFLTAILPNWFYEEIFVIEEGGISALKSYSPLIHRYFRHTKKSIYGEQLEIANAFQQVKVILMQNYRWDNAIINLRAFFPAIISNIIVMMTVFYSSWKECDGSIFKVFVFKATASYARIIKI
jgi:hypothetical protein